MAATLTTHEIAAAHRVSLRTAQRWAQTGKIPAVKVAGRWVISVPAQLDDYKPFQIDKARELIEQRGIVPSVRRPGFYTVASSDGTTTYLVHSAACSCPASRHGRRCYHLAAVALLEAACIRPAA